ncbi:MAG: hypothetical protein ACLFU3_00470 [Dichotomicrobium sp.]
MWMMRRKSAEELDSILYFLSNALTSVIDDNSYLAHHGATMPQIGAGLATAEIASRLAMFREQVVDVSEREFMVVTKLARARHWAQELRRHEPHLRADIDGFLAATASCEAMARNRMPDAQSVFDGQAQPKRFLADRVPGGAVAAEAALSLMERLEAAERGDVPEQKGPRYLIGGEMSVEALNDACERLLARLSVHYGWENEQAAVEHENEEAAQLDEAAEADGEEAQEPEASAAQDAEAVAADNTPDATGGEERGAAASEADQSEAEEQPDTVSAAASSEAAEATPDEQAEDVKSAPAPEEGAQSAADEAATDTQQAGDPDDSDQDAASDQPQERSTETPRAEKASALAGDAPQGGEQGQNAATASG